MDAMWHLIQYIPDMRRKEPRNIGVAMRADGQWLLKLYAVSEDGHINGRALRKFELSKDGYEAWVGYLTIRILRGELDDLFRFQRRHPAEFRVVPGGYTELFGEPKEVLSHLYSELVVRETISNEPWAKLLRNRVEQALTLAEIIPQPEIEVPARWGEETTAEPQDTVKFNYRYVNGRTHLMDRLQLHQVSVDHAKMIANDFYARANAARAAGAAQNFIAFYSSEAVDEMGSDSMLTPMFKVAEIVDVDNVPHAAEQLLQIMHH
ncbi:MULTISPECIES: hypothetical protein [Nocardia]|nr:MULTISPECIES: hypothetical protein [Nocardia]